MKKIYCASKVKSDPQFNMTSMIDVVFLLIIFFMLICQFIVRENYDLDIPDNVPGVVVPDRLDQDAVTVSVFPGRSKDQVMYAVRSHQFDPGIPPYLDDPVQLVTDMAAEIKVEAKKKAGDLVYLRADKSLTYGQVQKALLALSHAGASRVQLAAYKTEQSDETEDK
jgi:biopolymer transport protein ExbD